MKTRYLLAIICILALLGAACGDDTAGTASNNEADAGNNEVDMQVDEDQGNNPTEDMTSGDGDCSTNADCTPPEVCVYDTSTGEGTCGDAPGDGETGDMCTSGADCQSGLCINGLCADPCAGEEDCPAGYTCQSTDVDLDGGGSATIDVCVPEVTPCSANNDCSSPDICVVDRSGNDVSLTCDAPVGGGMLGDDCTADADCASNLCLAGTCTEPCETANDCAMDGSYLCESETIMTDGGGTADVTVCNPRPADTCISDGDCGGTDRCIANKTATDIEFRCGAPNAGGGETGDDCTDDSDCAQNLCVDGTCQGPCAEVGDCSTGEDFDCEVAMVDLGGGNSDSAQICVPPVLCGEDDDCPAAQNEVCYVREETDALDTICRDPNVGGGSLGQVCSGPLECANNFCLETRFRDVCVTPCVEDDDCTRAGYECTTHTVDLDGGGTADVDICTPETPTACTSNDDCGTNLDCAVIINEAGDGLESVCVPSTGGDATGVACQDDGDCASLVCLNGFCADPCTDTNQCGQDQVCSPSTTVDKDGQSGSFEICETLPEIQCTSSDDCTSGLRVCGQLVDNMGATEAYCTFPNAGGDQLGTTCTDSADCRENICFGDVFVYPNSTDPVAPECTVVCDEDDDCAASQLCTTWGDLNYCNTACSDNGDCAGNGRVCTIQGDALADEVDQICVEPWGSGELGALCDEASDCETGLCLNTYSYTGVSCTDDGQCGNDESCECPVDDPNCAPADQECASVEKRCTVLCNDNGDCSGGIAGNLLTTCSQDTRTQTPGGTSVAISTCAQN
jgi:hypothetical protein